MKVKCCKCTATYDLVLYEDKGINRPYTCCPYCGFVHLVDFIPSKQSYEEQEKIEVLKLGGAPDFASVGGARILDGDEQIDLSGADDVSVTDFIGPNFVIAFTIYGSKGDYTSRTYRIEMRNVTDGGSFTECGGEFAANSDTWYNAEVLPIGDAVCDAVGGYSWKNGLKRNIDCSTVSYTLTDEYYTEMWLSFKFTAQEGAIPEGKQYEFRVVDDLDDTVIGTLACKITTTVPEEATYYFGKNKTDSDVEDLDWEGKNWMGWGSCFGKRGGTPYVHPLEDHVRIGSSLNSKLNRSAGIAISGYAGAIMPMGVITTGPSPTYYTYQNKGYSNLIDSYLDFYSVYGSGAKTVDNDFNLILLTSENRPNYKIYRFVGFSLAVKDYVIPLQIYTVGVGWDISGNNLVTAQDASEGNTLATRDNMIHKHYGFTYPLQQSVDDYGPSTEYTYHGGVDMDADGNAYTIRIRGSGSGSSYELTRKVGFASTSEYVRAYNPGGVTTDKINFGAIDLPVFSPVIYKGSPWVYMKQNFWERKTGIVDGKIYIRGHDVSFDVDDISPSWDEYNGPVNRPTWNYFQFKVEEIV